jgi:hypothetical protein
MATRLAVLALVAAGLCSAQSKPNFTGEWTMNFEKSKFGENYRAPAKWVDKVVQKENELTIDRLELTHAGKRTGQLFYTTYGKESANEVMGNIVRSVVKWDGQDLTFHHVSKFNEKEITLDDRWTLSADGKTLSVKRHFDGGGIVADQVIVFDKTGK